MAGASNGRVRGYQWTAGIAVTLVIFLVGLIAGGHTTAGRFKDSLDRQRTRIRAVENAAQSARTDAALLRHRVEALEVWRTDMADKVDQLRLRHGLNP